jgi:transitional endoplasmic reticulum ATPase
MDFLNDIKLTQQTLFLFFVIPFSYYGYHAKYWYKPDMLKRADFFLRFFCILICVLVLAKLYMVMVTDRSQWQITILHLGPPLLAILNANKRKISGDGEESSGREAGPSPDFAPVPLNTKIEKFTWDDLIIEDSLKSELMSVIDLLKDPKTAKKYGIGVPKGILLNGPPGTGKTTIAKVIASNSNLAFFALKADEIVSKWVGESEKNLTKFFETAQQHAPCVIFIDEVDSLGKSRAEGNAAHSDNLLNHLLQLIDGVVKCDGLYIIAATNRSDLVDEALKRPGRLNRVIEVPLPNQEARMKLFELYLKNLKIEGDIDLEVLGKVTNKLPAAAIKEICNQAGLIAFKRESGSKNRNYVVKVSDIEESLAEFIDPDGDDDDFGDSKKKKEGFNPEPLNAQIEKIGWDNLIISDTVKQELQSVITLLKDPSTAKNYGIDVPKGILLNGPPGTGKTTIAKVIANQAGLSFFALQMDEIVSKWVGESEKNLTRLFKAAVKHSPSVIFVDEVDSIGKARSSGNASHTDNLLNHLLQMIDGVVKREGLYIIAATNRADLVDGALKRGGRLNKVIEIQLPTFEARKKLFELYLSRLKVGDDLDMDLLSEYSEGKSAADIREICNQAGLNAFKRESSTGSREYVVRTCDIQAAFEEFMGVQASGL